MTSPIITLTPKSQQAYDTAMAEMGGIEGWQKLTKAGDYSSSVLCSPNFIKPTKKAKVGFLIDPQLDFIADHGEDGTAPLGVEGGGVAVTKAVNELARRLEANELDFVVICGEEHPEDSQTFSTTKGVKHFAPIDITDGAVEPIKSNARTPHCIKDTDGQKFMRVVYDKLISQFPDRVVLFHKCQHPDQEQFGMFRDLRERDTGANDFIRQLAPQGIESAFFTGLINNVCVATSALQFKQMNPSVKVVFDEHFTATVPKAKRPNNAGIVTIREQLKEAGVIVVTDSAREEQDLYLEDAPVNVIKGDNGHLSPSTMSNVISAAKEIGIMMGATPQTQVVSVS